MNGNAVGAASDAEDDVREKHDITTFFNGCVWGFAFIRAWVYLMFLGMGVGVLSGAPDSVCAAVYLWSSAALTVTLFAGGVVPHVFEKALSLPLGQLGAIGVTLVGTACAVSAAAFPESPYVLLVLGGVGTGAGSGLIHLGYGEIHRNRPPSDVGIEVPMAVLIAAVVFSVVSFVPDFVQVGIVLALPVVSGVIMMRESSRFRACPALTWMDSNPRLIMPTPRLIVRVGACACGIGLADGVARQLFMSLAGVSSFDFYHPAMLISSVVLAALLIGFELLRRDNTFRGLYKLITFIIAASIAFVPSLSNLAQLYWLGPVITLVGYNAFNAFVWILLADLTYNFRLSAAATFGIGWGMLTLGSTAGQMAAASLGASVPLTPQLASFLAACGTLVVFAVCLFVMKDDDLVDIEDRKDMVMSVSDSIDFDDIDSMRISGVSYTTYSSSSERYDYAYVSIGDDKAADDDVESEQGGKEQETQERVQAEPDVEEAPGSVDAVDRQPPQRAPFKEKCAKLARDCGLTPRETEVLMLFAKGRSAARIQDELVISRGTVTTHLQHIYRKVDVHSKQELLDAIERERG